MGFSTKSSGRERRRPPATAPPARLPLTIESLPPTGDAYVDACFTFGFEEHEETRDFRQFGTLARVVELGNAGRFHEALTQLAEVAGDFPDFDFVFGWKAILLGRLGRLDEARAAGGAGLECCRSKFGLCEDLGAVEFEHGGLAEAVSWWIRSAVIQLVIRRAQSLQPFVYLAYAAAALRDPGAAERLLEEADRHRPERVRMSEEGHGRLLDRVAREANESLRAAIRRLCEVYMA